MGAILFPCLRTIRTQRVHFSVVSVFHRHQTDSVSDYTTKFNKLMHYFLAHNISWDPAIFPSHYVDCLKDEIRVVVIVHNPILLFP